VASSFSFAEAREVVISALARAAVTLRRLPMPLHGRPTPTRPSWPADWPDNAAGDTSDEACAVVIRPSARAISELDRVLPWLSCLDTVDRRLVWARANGLSWPRLARKFGISVGRVRYRWNSAVDRVVATAVHDAIVSSRETEPLRSSCKFERLGR
jgi:hypothetical protein